MRSAADCCIQSAVQQHRDERDGWSAIEDKVNHADLAWPACARCSVQRCVRALGHPSGIDAALAHVKSAVLHSTSGEASLNLQRVLWTESLRQSSALSAPRQDSSTLCDRITTTNALAPRYVAPCLHLLQCLEMPEWREHLTAQRFATQASHPAATSLQCPHRTSAFKTTRHDTNAALQDGAATICLHKVKVPHRDNKYEWDISDCQGDFTDGLVLKHGDPGCVAAIERKDGSVLLTLEQGGFYTLNKFRWGSKTYRYRHPQMPHAAFWAVP